MGKKRTHKKGSKTKSRSVKRRTKSRSVKRRTKSHSSGKRERKRQTSKKAMKGGGKIMELNATFTRSKITVGAYKEFEKHYFEKGTKGEKYCVFDIKERHTHHSIVVNNFIKYTIDNIPGNTYKDFTYAIRYNPNTVCTDNFSYNNMVEFEINNKGFKLKLIPTALLSEIKPE